VNTPLGVRLCRPSQVVLDILPDPQRGPFAKEDGEPVIDADGRRILCAAGAARPVRRGGVALSPSRGDGRMDSRITRKAAAAAVLWSATWPRPAFAATPELRPIPRQLPRSPQDRRSSHLACNDMGPLPRAASDLADACPRRGHPVLTEIPR
jgi:hypothetical protein